MKQLMDIYFIAKCGLKCSHIEFEYCVLLMSVVFFVCLFCFVFIPLLEFTGNSVYCPESESKADLEYCRNYSSVCVQGVSIEFYYLCLDCLSPLFQICYDFTIVQRQPEKISVLKIVIIYLLFFIVSLFN